MTPQERQLVEDLFDRLAQLEKAPRDGEAERVIAEGLRRAPNAIYAPMPGSASSPEKMPSRQRAAAFSTTCGRR